MSAQDMSRIWIDSEPYENTDTAQDAPDMPESVFVDRDLSDNSLALVGELWALHSSIEGSEYIRADLVPTWRPRDTAPKDG